MHGRNRIIPIHTAILPYIKKRYNKDNKYLMTIDGKPVSYSKYKTNIFNPILEELGIKGKTPHCTRHTFATKIDEVESNKLVIKRILGHATQDITARYTRTNIDTLINTIDKLNW